MWVLIAFQRTETNLRESGFWYFILDPKIVDLELFGSWLLKTPLGEEDLKGRCAHLDNDNFKDYQFAEFGFLYE